jgi:hypothetical protein
MSKRAAFYEAHQTPADRLALIDEMEPYFDGCSDGVRARISAIQARLAHEDPAIWRPALDEIAGYIRERRDA